MTEQRRPLVSVIVIAYNSERTLGWCLGCLRRSEWKDYELLVVDDGSQDRTAEIARRFADKVIQHGVNGGMSTARNTGNNHARGEILIHVDSDVLVPPDAIPRIVQHFQRHPEEGALTALLSRTHLNTDFFSQYKNLYMHYHFKKLPHRVTFLYGSLHAVRRPFVRPYDHRRRIANDTEMGQRLTGEGVAIGLLQDLEVIHLKRHNFFSLLKNDFSVAADWAGIFLSHRAWREVGKKHTGYAHASLAQLASLCVLPFLDISLVAFGFAGDGKWAGGVFCVFAFLWILFNAHFFAFLKRERGGWFALSAAAWTLWDQHVMLAGILAGFFKEICWAGVQGVFACFKRKDANVARVLPSRTGNQCF